MPGSRIKRKDRVNNRKYRAIRYFLCGWEWIEKLQSGIKDKKFDLQTNIVVYCKLAAVTLRRFENSEFTKTHRITECDAVEIKQRLNEVLVKLFRNINNIEEQAIKTEEYKDVTANDMHVIEAIGTGSPRNMTAVARTLGVTTGTLTISVNSLVKKGFVERMRSEEDRRVVLVSLSGKGKKAFLHHQKFHEEMIEAVVRQLDEKEKEILEKALKNLNDFFLEKSREKW